MAVDFLGAGAAGFGWQNKIMCCVFSFNGCKWHIYSSQVTSIQAFVKVGNAAEVKVHADFCSFAFGFLLSQVEYFVVVAWM